MIEYAILMFVFGLLILAAGFYIYRGHDDILVRGYYEKKGKPYLSYVGKITMLVGISPIISGIVALFVDSIIIVFLVFALSLGITFYIGIKKFKEEE